MYANYIEGQWVLMNFCNREIGVSWKGYLDGNVDGVKAELGGDKIRENILTGHKFSNLLKSVLGPWFTSREKFWLFSHLDCWKMAIPHLKWKLTLLEKTSKLN